MSSLFGQVWFWSLVAFLVGALLTWVLLVRPAQQRVQQLEKRPPQRPEQQPPPPTYRQGADTTERGAGSDAPAAGAGADSAVAGEQQRPPTQWLERDSVAGAASGTEAADDAGAFFRAEDELERHGGVADDGAPPVGRMGQRFDAPERAGADGDDRAPDSLSAPVEEPPVGEYTGSGGLDATLNPAAPSEPPAVAPGDRDDDQVGLPTPSMGFAAPVDPTAGQPPPPEPASSGFVPPTEPPWDAAPPEPQEQPTSAQEPAGDGGLFAASTGAVAEPPVGGTEADSDLSAFDDGFGWSERTATTTSTQPSTDLPQRRRPANQIKGGFEPPKPIQPSLRQTVRRDPGDSDLGPGALFEPTADGAGQSQPGAPAPAREAPADNVPPGPFGPGSAMPLPGGDRPAPSFSVKASVTALRYCTEESSQFDQMTAEVWFASVADAERVGFRPLDG